MKTNLCLSIAAVGAVAFCLALPTPASAQIYRDTSAGGACKPAAAGSTAFTFGNTYLQNKSTVGQYVICHFDMFDIAGNAQAPSMLKIYFFAAGDFGGTPVCVTQMGFFTQDLHTTSVKARSVVVAGNGGGEITFESGDMARGAIYDTLTLNCKVPPGFKMGLIERTDPEPVSGTGWTP